MKKTSFRGIPAPFHAAVIFAVFLSLIGSPVSNGGDTPWDLYTIIAKIKSLFMDTSAAYQSNDTAEIEAPAQYRPNDGTNIGGLAKDQPNQGPKKGGKRYSVYDIDPNPDPPPPPPPPKP